ncbi:SCO6745 family protein [Streptomyces fragilis]|uniref:SalK n=1 Tax=Streptomyces fragilis TaxID=67301 RepID=A0ABV2YFT8_9ACTN|nr:hypothetical protein [Streptomyces fragilis]
MAEQTGTTAAAAVGLTEVRRIWHLLEPLHAVLYYAPEAFEEAAALGYDVEERWPSYFAFRAAPLGAVGAVRAASAFYSMSPRMVERQLPAVWEVASPEEVLAARLRGVDRAYRSLFGERVDGPEIRAAAALTRRAAEAADLAGRPLAAANAELPWPREPHLQLWHAATILREHRGDGHVAALMTAGLDPVEALVSFEAIGAASRQTLASREWSAQEWEAARSRLAGRGLVTEAGTATEEGRALRERVERETDRLASAPWRASGAADTTRLADLLGDFWVTVIASGLLPADNALGIGKV